MQEKVINICSHHENPWLRQFPDGKPCWHGWRFLINAVNENYDYLVVFDDFNFPLKIRCRPENILHLATEPPSIRHYNEDYLSQFFWIVTQDETISHPRKIYHQSGLTWFLGWNPKSKNTISAFSFEMLDSVFDQPKTQNLSIICSKKLSTPGHAKRLHFAKAIKKYYGHEIDFYGNGICHVDDKLDALQNYRFSIVIENSNTAHYFSEKFTDCVIAGAYPLYYGCPNLDHYFPKNSFVRINIEDTKSSIQTINNAIEQDLDQLFRPELRTAKFLAMEKYNLFPLLIDLILYIEMNSFSSHIAERREILFPSRDKMFKERFSSRVSKFLRPYT